MTVGAGGTHTTIALAYAACTTATDNYIIEIRSDYSAAEAKPITLTQKTNSGVIIRPQVATAISDGAALQIFHFNGADNVTIDGRVNSAGSTPVLTIENTQSTAGRYAIKFEADARNNTIKYCLVKGSSDFGTIYFGAAGGGGGDLGNDNNIIDYCTISKSAAAVPRYAINSAGTATKENSSITISNCDIIDFYDKGIYEATNSDAWTVTGNSFYLTASYTPTADRYAVYMNDGSGHTVSGNFFGGQAANCGGSAYTLSASGFYMTCIYFSNTVTAGTCTVNGNTIKNFSITTNGSPIYCFRGIYCAGAADYTIGTSGAGNGNAIGDTVSGTGNITISASGTPSNIFRGIQVGSTGTNTVRYNAMGSITCTGTATGTLKSRFIEVLGPVPATGATTIRYNTIGNPATLANISFPVAGNTYGFLGIAYDANSNADISYNLIQNVSNLGTGNVGENEGITVIGTGTNTVSYNTIGNTTANNIVYASNMLMHGIWFKGTTGNFTSTGNIVQNFNMTSAGASVIYHGQCIDALGVVNFDKDTVRNITVAGTNTSATDPFVQGFRVRSSSGAGQVVNQCAVKNMTATGSANVFLTGIYTELTCSGSITRCHISGNAVTSATASAIHNGMYLKAGGNWDVYNNVVLIDNGGNASPTISGIEVAHSTAVTTNIYHNSVKIYGTGAASAAACSTACFRKSNTNGTLTVKNNVWQNIRANSAGSAMHYACRISSTSGTHSYDYNYLQTTAAPIAYWNLTGDLAAIANWNTMAAVGTDVTGSVSIENVYGYSSTAPIPGGGVTYAPVPQDKIFCNRASPPWIGAWECSPLTSITASCMALGGSNNDYAYSLAQDADGSFVLGGYTQSFVTGGADMYMIKTNTSGTIQWKLSIGGATTEQGLSMTSTGDGGYAIAGWNNTAAYNAGGSGSSQMYTATVTSAGALQWTATNGTSGQGDQVNGIVRSTSDNGFLLAGLTNFAVSPFNDVYAVKLNSSGTYQWNFRYGGTHMDELSAAIVTTDGGFLLVGSTRSSIVTPFHIYVIKISATGTYQWDNTIGGASHDNGYAVVEATDGGLVIAGKTQSFGAGGYDMYVVKINSSGSALSWSRTIGGAGTDYANSIIQSGDGGYIVAGTTSSYGAGGNDVYVAKLDDLGVVQWTRTFGGTGTEEGRQVVRASSGMFAVAGWTNTGIFTNGQNDMYFATLNTDGRMCGCNPSDGGTYGTGGALLGAYGSGSALTDHPLSGGSTTSGGTAIVVCEDVLLPVQLLSFSARCDNDGIHLNWQTASEMNNDYFMIEKSTDGKSFIPVGKVAGAGNSSVMSSYQFVDAEFPAESDVRYYRLRQVDFNGQYEYFGPLSARCSIGDEWSLVMLNNPAKDVLQANLFLPNDAPVTVDVFDLPGRNIWHEKPALNKGSNLLRVNISEYSKGIYFLSVNSRFGRITKKFIIR